MRGATGSAVEVRIVSRARDVIVGISAISLAVIAARTIGDRPLEALWVVSAIGWTALVLTRETRVRVWAVLPIASLVLAMAIVEALLEAQERMDDVSDLVFDPPYTIESPHPLGYRAIASTRTRALRTRAAGVVYDVTYTVDQDRLRVTPGSIDDARGTVAFFGCSFTFGEGLEDDETLPSRFASAAHLRVRNYAMHGWGPQQALRLIELGEVERTAESPLLGAVFVLIPDHVERVTGEAYWLAYGPRYELGQDGEAHLAGRFVDPGDRLAVGIASSQLGRRMAPLFRDDDAGIRLLAAVIARMRDLLRARLGGELTVLFWPEGSPRAESIRRALRARDIPVLEAGTLLGADPGEPRFRIDGDPAHPNADAARRIGEALARVFPAAQ